jgi:hypothetical protein
MATPLGLSGGYLSGDGPQKNALLRPQGQAQFSDIDSGWFRGPKFRDLLGRGTVKKQIDLGPRASDNALLQYNFPKQQSDNNPFTFF